MMSKTTFVLGFTLVACLATTSYHFFKHADQPNDEAKQGINAESLKNDLAEVQAVIDAEKARQTQTKSSATGSMSKCTGQGKTVYTDSKCPAGMAEKAIKNGTLNTIAGQKIINPETSGGMSLNDHALKAQLGDQY